MNFLQKVLLYQGWKVRYWTAWTTTTTTLASSWGLLINIDSATGDIAQTASGWIEDEKFWFNAREFATSTSAEFDSTVTRTGRLTLKLSTLDATGRIRCFPFASNNYSTTATNLANLNKFIPCKSSTKYRYSIWVKTNNVVNNSTFVQFQQLTVAWVTSTAVTSSLLSWTVDWTRLSWDFTTSWTAAFIGLQFAIETAWNIADAWFDINSMTLEEVIEPVANSLVTPSPSLVSFTAVGSTDNIDQSMTTWSGIIGLWDWVRNFHYQQFLPTKSKFTWVAIQRTTNVWTFTWNVIVKIRNDNADSPWTTVLASYTITNAVWNAIAWYTDYVVPLPCNLTIGGSTKYWIEVGSSTSDVANYGRLNYNASNIYTSWLNKYSITDWWALTTYAGDMYFKTLYYKPTTNFKASQNNLNVSISADEDGFAEWAVTNLLTWAYTWGLWASATDLLTWASVYSATAWAWPIVTTQSIINNYWFYNYAGYNWIGTPATTNTQDLIWKFTTTRPITGDVVVTFRTIERTTWTTTMAYSLDNSAYTAMGTIANSANTEINYSYTITGLVWETDFFIRFRRAWTSSKQDIANLAVSTTVDTASINGVLKNYPTNKDIIKQYSTTLWSATTSATYRATKWGFPAIEYSATEYQFLDVDTTATGSTVAFSELGSSYTTVADGASIAITSTSTPTIWVKANITANRLYLSSNDYTASSEKDGSMKQSVVYSVIQ